MSSLKKASLSLSINAVVILVLAIAMLGLGLGFTKKMFAKFGDTLQVPEPELTATESDPIVMISDQIEIKKNKDASLPIRYYSSMANGDIGPVLRCADPANPGGTPDIIRGSPMNIGQGEQKTFRILIRAKSFNETSICTLYMIGDPLTVTDFTTAQDSKQVTFIPTG